MTLTSSIVNPTATRFVSAWTRCKIIYKHGYNTATKNAFVSSSAVSTWQLQDNLSPSPQHSVPQQKQQYMISPTLKQKSDLVVVLDMDECMIHSQFLTEDEYNFRQHDLHTTPNSGNNNKSTPCDKEYDNNSIGADKVVDTVESFKIILPDKDAVIVNKRPHLNMFLSQLSKRFETHVFTAAMEVYASPVLNRLDPNDTIFSHRFYRDRCILDEEMGVYVKDLRVVLPFGSASRVKKTQAHRQEQLIYNEKRIVLIDNNPMSFLANPRNGILVSNFYDDVTDTTLLSVLKLLDELDEVDDVRPILDDLFGLSSALKEIATQRQRE